MGSYFGFQNFKYIQSSNLGFSNVSEQKNISQSKGERDKHEFNTCQYGFMLLFQPISTLALVRPVLITFRSDEDRVKICF